MEEVIVIPPLVIKEQTMNETGYMTFKFSKPIFIPDHFKDLDSKRRKLSSFED